MAAGSVERQWPWHYTAVDQRMAHPAWAARVRDSGGAAFHGVDVEYDFDGMAYQGYVSHPAGKLKSSAGALVAHQWKGLGDYERSRADELAAMGYTAFALDVYGKGVRCNTTSCAQVAMQAAMSNVSRLQRLISAGTHQLLRWADATQLVAIGYCFGGSIVLELARHPRVNASAGVEYRAISSVHGVLAPLGSPAAKGEVRGRVQVHHAELDFQGDGALTSLEAELKRGVNGTDGLWETAKYAKCEHGWTEPDSAVYRARAAVQAHKATFEFFEMALGEEDPTSDPYPPLPFCRNDHDTAARTAAARALPPPPSPPSPPPPLPVPTSPALTEEFVFSAAYLNSSRQWGKCLHAVIKYRYASPKDYFDYKPMRQMVISRLIAPTPELPVSATWELVNRALVRDILARYPVAALSSQVVVRHEMSPQVDEPGTHGSVVSAGDPAMSMPGVPWVDAFSYDCTRSAPPPPP